MTALTRPDIAFTEGYGPQIFENMYAPTKSLAIWHRSLSEDLHSNANALCRKQFAFRSTFNPHEETESDRLRSELARETKMSARPIEDDLIELAQIFTKICNTDTTRIRLKTVSDNGCSLFHFDNVAMRLVITYRGAGTQWVYPEFAANARIQQRDYKGPLNEIDTGHVALFRGRKSNAGGMMLHRSPPLGGKKPPRLVGVID